MSKFHETLKEARKQPQKTLKERRQEKKAKQNHSQPFPATPTQGLHD